MPTRFVIWGGGGLGLEVACYIQDMKVACPAASICLKGVLDTVGPRKDDLRAVEPSIAFYDDLSAIPMDSDIHVVIAIGDPAARYRLSAEVRKSGRHLGTVIHPTAYVAATARIAPGVILAPFSFVGPLGVLGESAILNTYASVGHDAVVGGGSTLSPYSCLNGRAVVGRGCFLGSGAVISPNSKIGDGSRVSAGSFFNGETEAGSMVHGNPAKARVMLKVDLQD